LNVASAFHEALHKVRFFHSDVCLVIRARKGEQGASFEAEESVVDRVLLSLCDRDPTDVYAVQVGQGRVNSDVMEHVDEPSSSPDCYDGRSFMFPFEIDQDGARATIVAEKHLVTVLEGVLFEIRHGQRVTEGDTLADPGDCYFGRTSCFWNDL
jgi:hypothetical protein